MATPAEVLDTAFQRASSDLTKQFVTDSEILERLDFVCRNIKNRACLRLLLACSLAKVHNPNVDIRKPYTEIGTPDAYSGRSLDEKHLGPFLNKHKLPTNSTTAFLTPALRNMSVTLTPDLNLEGRPPELYKTTLQLLTDVYTEKVSAEDLLTEAFKCLIIQRDEKQQWMNTIIEGLKSADETIPLAAEAIVTLIDVSQNTFRSSLT